MSYSHYYYNNEQGERLGPLSINELVSMARDGKLTPFTQINDGESWQTARDIKPLAEVFNSPLKPKPKPVADSPHPRRMLKLVYKFIIISLIAHLVCFLIFGGLVIFRKLIPEEVTFEAPVELKRIEPKKREHKLLSKEQMERSSRPKLQRRLQSVQMSEIAMPQIDAKIKPVMTKFSPIEGLSLGAGDGFEGLGSEGINVAPTMGKRCSYKWRLKQLKKMGGKPEVEKAVQKGLSWLATRQNSDGSWGTQYKCSMTGLALLAYLGYCETPQSIRHGQKVRKSIDFLLKYAKDNDYKIGNMNDNSGAYEHGIATYALSEAYILTDEGRIGSVVSQALRVITKGQTEDGGWKYRYAGGKNSDISVTGWQIQALKAGKLSHGKSSVSSSLRKAVKLLENCQNKDNGGFPYRTNTSDPRPSLSGVGVLGLQMGGEGDSKAAKKGIEFLLKNYSDLKYDGADLYAWYYNTQACFNEGGEAWEKWNAGFQDEILNTQNDDGSWKIPRGLKHAPKTDRDIYVTCLCILMLETYYRYLPTYDLS